MPRKPTGKRKTPLPLVPLASDGLHYVRPASIKDRHPMRFVVDQFKVEGLPNNVALPRHCESVERGIELMATYTIRACKENPALKTALKQAGEVEIKAPRAKKVKPVYFPVTRFTCVMANCVAQVWVCTKETWEGQPVGRRSAEGRPPTADNLPHRKGEFAVLKGTEPEIDNDTGLPKVYPLLMQAEAAMQRLFDETPGDQRMTDNNDPNHPTTTVYQNLTHSVHFDPDFNGPLRPFNVFNTNVFRPVLNARANIPLQFQTITGAIEEADRLDKLARGVS